MSAEKIYGLLKSGLLEYLRTNGFSECVLGLSGGVDSALVAAIACDAIGAKNVHCVFMPSKFTSVESKADAKQVAENLCCHFSTIPIDAIFSSFASTLPPHLKKGHKFSVVEENLQARIRANILYALSNEHGWLVLNTSNKSEALTGYGTLYGDMAGGYGAIADAPKTAVFALAKHATSRAGGEPTPSRVIKKDPPAELSEGQKDSDSLPPYDLLDIILFFQQQGKAAREIAEETGAPLVTVEGVFRLIEKSAHKRKMAPPCTRVDANLYKELVFP
jgi:NAD+ synthase (glutamine-hydrolysing)